jgi:II/X family phage/plasmid replication protein
MASNSDGGLDWGIFKRLEMEGSHSAKIQVRAASTMADGRSAIRVFGNVVKWFQGHNIFGTDDMHGLVHECIRRILDLASITPTSEESAAWLAGDVEFLRVDVTDSHDLGTRERVMNAIRSLDLTAHLKMRGRGHYNGHSLLYGKGSRHWSLTLYAKGPELDKHRLPVTLADTPLKAHADRLLRSEIRMLSMHLKRLGLHRLEGWNDNTSSEVHHQHLENLEISEAFMLDLATLDGLPPRLRAAYQLWKDGHDLRVMFSRPTFYRYRSQLLPVGIDISVKQDRAPESNVVPLRVTLIGKPASVPDWAIGSSLYFQPRQRDRQQATPALRAV